MKPPRRAFLQTLALGTGALSACRAKTPPPQPSFLGAPISPYGERSPFVHSQRQVSERVTRTPEQASSLTPLADTYGIITPSSLHFERHHSGVPKIDPAQHTLMIHGMVDRPLVFTVAELQSLPSMSRIHFVTCPGNSGNGWAPTQRTAVQGTHGSPGC